MITEWEIRDVGKKVDIEKYKSTKCKDTQIL